MTTHDYYSTKNRCRGCGTLISDRDVFPDGYDHCKNYCCGCCPSKNGYRGESCQKDYLRRQAGLPVGVLENLATYDEVISNDDM
jgi:hypothetical protein